jgi:hypothetical protein
MWVDRLDPEALVERIVARVADRYGDERRILDRRDLSDRIGISERTVTDLVNRGELRARLLIGGIRCWEWAAILKHVGAKQCRQRRQGRGMYSRKCGAVPSGDPDATTGVWSADLNASTRKPDRLAGGSTRFGKQHGAVLRDSVPVGSSVRSENNGSTGNGRAVESVATARARLAPRLAARLSRLQNRTGVHGGDRSISSRRRPLDKRDVGVVHGPYRLDRREGGPPLQVHGRM